MKLALRTFVAATLFLGTCGNVFAASDGTEGATSTGSSSVSLTIPELIVIKGLADLALGSYTGTGSLSDNEDVIISGNDDQGGANAQEYSVAITSSDTNCSGAQFRLQRATPATGTYINYTVSWNDVTGTGGATAAACNAALASQTAANQVLTSNTENANISISVAQAALQAAPYGTYADTLSILITPET